MSRVENIFEKKYTVLESSEEYTPLSSFRYGETVRFVLLLSELQKADSIVLRLHRDSDQKMFLYTLEQEEFETQTRFSTVVSTKELCCDDNGGLFFYCYDVYYPDGCVTFAGEDGDLLHVSGEEQKRQLLIYRKDYYTPQWMRGGIIYHIFVDRFCCGADIPLKEGAVRNCDWDNGIPQYAAYPGADVPNNEFFGGDLYGIAEKIDYIASLGVSCIYLSPVFDAASNHKYDTGDYEHVDSMFGGDEALRYLIQVANQKGIRIILDGVFNHTGADSRYFNKFGKYASLGAYQSPESPYYKWYCFSDYPDEYESWWGVQILPKVRCDEPSYRDYILGENGIIKKWMDCGISGWRLDVADELSDTFLDALRNRVRLCDAESVIYGEVWENATNKVAYGKRRHYLDGRQLDSVMNYPLRNAVISYVRDGNSSVLRECIHTVYRQYPHESANILMNFLGTHDTPRVLTELVSPILNGCSNEELSIKHLTEEERKTAVKRLKIAYSIISVMPGLPCIFYGDEAGMEGYGDPFCRRPFPWGREDQSLTVFYREMGQLHRSHAVFQDGYINLLHITDNGVALLRYNGTDTPILLIVNRSDRPLSVRFSAEVSELRSSLTVCEGTIAAMSNMFFIPSEEKIQVVF